MMMDSTDWVSEYKKKPVSTNPDSTKRQLEIQRHGQEAVEVFAQVTEKLRQQLFSGGGSFDNLNKCFGITESNKVIFIKPPSSNNHYFGVNIGDLEDLARTLQSLVPCPLAKKKLGLLGEIFSKCPRSISKDYILDQEVKEKLALNNVGALTDEEIVRFIMNLAKLSQTGPNRLWLDHNTRYRKYITSNLPGWLASVRNNQILQAVLSHSEQGYKVHELARFCLNCFNGQKYGIHLENKVVLSILCSNINGLAHHLLMAYGSALVERYTHPQYSSEMVFTTSF